MLNKWITSLGEIISTRFNNSSDNGSSLPPISKITNVPAYLAVLAATILTYSGISLCKSRILPIIRIDFLKIITSSDSLSPCGV